LVERTRFITQTGAVYTGITRGKRLVVLVGQRRALAIAIKPSRAERRWSKLHQWLGTDRVLER
jgi:exodeoxyribonuclease V alpha subunit